MVIAISSRKRLSHLTFKTKFNKFPDQNFMHALIQMPSGVCIYFEKEQKSVYMYLDLFSVFWLTLQFSGESIACPIVCLCSSELTTTRNNRFPISNYLLQIKNTPIAVFALEPSFGPCTIFSSFMKLKMGIQFELRLFPYTPHTCRMLNVTKFFVKLQINCLSIQLNKGSSRGLQVWL